MGRGDLKVVGSKGLVWCLGSVDVWRKLRAREQGSTNNLCDHSTKFMAFQV